MNTHQPTAFARRPRALVCAARAVVFAACLPLLPAAAAQSNAFRQARPGPQPPAPQQRQGPAASTPRTPAPAPAADDESRTPSFGEMTQAERPPVREPARVLRSAKTVFVRSKTVFVKDSEVENALRKRPEFRAWGMVVTRDETRADLIVEVERKAFTKRFVFTVVEPHTLAVVASGKARSVIFGDSIAHKVAEKFVNRVRPFRT